MTIQTPPRRRARRLIPAAIGRALTLLWPVRGTSVMPEPPRDRRAMPARARGALAVLLAAEFALAGCSAMPKLPAAPPAEDYKLDAGDTVQVDVYGQRDLSGKFTLDTAGRVSLLRAGAVTLRGLTLRQAEGAITERLRVELVQPEVTVNIAEYRPVYVTGEVRKPGNFPFAGGMTVLRAVALAGGYTQMASRWRITVVREGLPPSRADESAVLQPGDTIDVGESIF